MTLESLAGALVAGKYWVLRTLGEGSLGMVYLCRQASDDRLFALKLPHQQLMASEEFRSQFWLEFVAAGRLQSPDVVTIVEFGEDLELGTYYVAMPYVPYPDLGTVLRENGALSDQRSAAIISQVLEALAQAHAESVIHLNLKPSNIFVQITDDGATRVQVADFGCARLTSHAGAIGSPAYGSPEQALGQDVDSRSDIYAVGVMLYEMLAGRRPFEAASAFELGRMHCGSPPPPPSGFRRVHPVLESVCLKALSKTPQARYQSAAEMLEALAVVRKHAPPRKSVSPPRQQDSLAPFVRAAPEVRDTIPKRRTGLAVVTAVCLGCVAWAGYGTFLEPQARVAGSRTASSTSSTAAPKPRPQLDLLVPDERATSAPDALPQAAQPEEPANPDVQPKAAPPEEPEPAQLVAIQSSASPPPSAAASVGLGAVLPHTATSEALRRALDLPAITECYRNGLNQPGAFQQPLAGRLDLESDDSGRVCWSKLRAAQFSPALRKCVERAARAASMPYPWGEKLEASVMLQFNPR